MTAIYAFVIMMCLYALGDIIATKTKGLLSGIFVICVALLLCFWAGLPSDIATIAGISGIGSTLVSPLVVGIGTTMNLNELKRQWRTAVVSFLGVTCGVIFVMVAGQFIIGWNAAAAAAPIFAGASVALMIINETLTNKGLIETLGAIVMTVFALQKFIGVPLTSFCLQREAQRFLKDPHNIEHYSALTNQTTAETSTKARPLAFFSKIDKPSVNFAKLALVAALSNFLGGLTNGNIHYLVISLLMGVLFTELGFLKKNSLGTIDSNFLMTFLIIMTVFSSLASVTPASLVKNIGPVILVLLLGSIGVICSGIIFGKIFKVGAYLAIALGITCTYGFPTTTLISQEISEIGSTKEEKSALLNYLLPKMTVAGFVTVTIGSVVLAGIVAPMIK